MKMEDIPIIHVEGQHGLGWLGRLGRRASRDDGQPLALVHRHASGEHWTRLGLWRKDWVSGVRLSLWRQAGTVA